MIRPALQQAILRGRELLFCLAIVAVGLWLASWGGYFFVPLGGFITVAGLGLGLQAWRRLRFLGQDGAQGRSPGMVEIIEGEIRYFGPSGGGMIAVEAMESLHRVTLYGHSFWRLQGGGEALLIPMRAQGAERLFDVFSSLPQIDVARLVNAPHLPLKSKFTQGNVVALHSDHNRQEQLIWRRSPRVVLT